MEAIQHTKVKWIGNHAVGKTNCLSINSHTMLALVWEDQSKHKHDTALSLYELFINAKTPVLVHAINQKVQKFA